MYICQLCECYNKINHKETNVTWDISALHNVYKFKYQNKSPCCTNLPVKAMSTPRTLQWPRSGKELLAESSTTINRYTCSSIELTNSDSSFLRMHSSRAAIVVALCAGGFVEWNLNMEKSCHEAHLESLVSTVLLPIRSSLIQMMRQFYYISCCLMQDSWTDNRTLGLPEGL